ncbi:DUF2790 domain-containing protein [Pseudomonas sp. AN-1]|uniref:DUF2790 domain-containing protein n=1 Tax=Pseudomonas sp. AN-1 TaxID=3096605 RepID=UPI002A6B700E|nr:DUF2790 domain-containing protein [Pseudomonas sp. AN-1]WPP46508.1 DUF2790 domain-containing protein [Pseudomonas sp. AN-1]
MKLLKSRSMQLCCAVAVLSAVSATSVVIAQSESDTPPPLMVMEGVKDVQTPEFKQYQYGMPLDISKVVKVEYFIPDKAKTYCGAIPAAMTYEDSKGEKRGLVYLYPETSGCTN